MSRVADDLSILVDRWYSKGHVSVPNPSTHNPIAMGFFDKLRDGLSRTTQQIVDRFDEIVRRRTPTSRSGARADRRRDDRGARGAADLGRRRRRRHRADRRRRSRARARDGASLRDLVKQEIRAIFAAVDTPVRRTAQPPQVTLIVGVNGTGKTTTVGKLANLLKPRDGSRSICAADTFRAAAVEQLEIWARARRRRHGARARRRRSGGRRVRRDSRRARRRGRDPILVDTAGRLHTRVNLMNELDKIRRVAAREVAGAPQEVLLVLDATVGQNGVTQAREFMGVAGVNGIVLTKLDGTAKGGVAVAIAHDLEAADPLRRRRRRHRRSGAVLGRGVRRRLVRGEVVARD